MNRLAHLYIFSVVCIIQGHTLLCQSSTYVPNQYIIQWRSEGIETRGKIAMNDKLPVGVNQKVISHVPLLLSLLTYDTHIIDENQVLTWIKNQSNILQFQRNHYTQHRIIPNDPLLKDQWYHINPDGGDKDLDSDLAWNLSVGGLSPLGDTVVICVIDSGISSDHPDLMSNMWRNIHEIPNNGVDDDQNGYIDDVDGWNVLLESDEINNQGNHGSQVTGVIAAKGNNEIGVVGIMWDTKIMFVNYGGATEANAILAYSYPYIMRKLYNETNGAKGAYVVASNSSWGRNGVFAVDAPIWCAMYDSMGEVGIISCAATANNNVDVDTQGDMPTSCESPYLITVTNVNRTDLKNGLAGYGRQQIDLGAYGERITTTSNVGYSTETGTSVSTPMVTSVIGLMYTTTCSALATLSKMNPGKAALLSKEILLNSTIPLDGLKDISTTGGKLNAHRAIVNSMKLCENCDIATNIDIVPKDTEAVFVFDGLIDDGTIDIRYRRVDQLTWTVVPNVIRMSTITNLSLCSTYEWQVKNQCYVSNSEYGYSRFFETRGCCKAPKKINISATESTITLAWEKDVESSSYQIQYKKVLDTAWTTIVDTQNSLTFSDLDLCTKYELRIKSTCAKYNNESMYTRIYETTTSCGSCTSLPHCEIGKKNDSYEWIESTRFGNINVSNQKAGNDGYIDYTGTNKSAFKRGRTYPFKVTFGYIDNIPIDDYYRLYIDFNQDGIFSDEEELADIQGKVKSEFETNIVIPEDAVLGPTKMRHIIHYDDFGGSCDNLAFRFGEVEDYCIDIIGIDEAENFSSTSFKLYPNPTSGIVKVSHPLGIQKLSVVNAIGQNIFQNSVQQTAEESILDLTNIFSGIYFIKLTTESGVSYMRLVVKVD